MKKSVFLVTVFISLIVIPLCSTLVVYVTENVFIAIIDGLRNQEAFEDPTLQYISHIWNDLRPRGTVYKNIYTISHTSTCPGHATVTSRVEYALKIFLMDCI